MADSYRPSGRQGTPRASPILAGQEVFRLSPEELATLDLPIRSVVSLGGAGRGGAVEVTIMSDAPSVVSLAAKMLGCELSIEEGAADVLTEFVNTVAGRIRASLLLRDIDLKMGLPLNAIDDPARSPSEWSQPFAFRSGTRDRGPIHGGHSGCQLERLPSRKRRTAGLRFSKPLPILSVSAPTKRAEVVLTAWRNTKCAFSLSMTPEPCVSCSAAI